MDESKFWGIIDQTRYGTPTVVEHARLLETALESLSFEDIISFGQMLENKLSDLNKNDLWEIAYIINTGCGDDDFRDFRAGIIARGKEAFDIAVINPAGLGNFDKAEDLIKGEEFHGAYRKAWRNKTGQYMGPQVNYDDSKPKGEDFSEDELDLSSRHPELFAKYWRSPDRSSSPEN